MRILHISDIHRAPNVPTSNTTLLGKLLDDIRYTYDEDNTRLGPAEPRLGLPDLLVVSGDLTQRADEAEFEVALRFLEGLLPLVNDDRRRVVLVPGNHDVNWAIAARSYTPAEKEDYDHQPPTGEPYRQSVKRAPDATYWRKNDATYTDRFKPFKAFFDAFYQGAYTYPLVRDCMFKVYDLSEPLSLVVVGFNSCDEIDAYLHEGKLSSLDQRAFINTDAIYNAEQSPAFHAGQTGLLRIAVFHHNIRSVGHSEDFLESKYLQILKRHGFDLCLHGHVHTPGHDLFDATQAKVLPVVGAGSLAAPYSDRPPAVPMGYNLVVIDRQSGGIWVHTRRHDESYLVWAADYQCDGKPYFVVRPPMQETAPPPPGSAVDAAQVCDVNVTVGGGTIVTGSSQVAISQMHRSGRFALGGMDFAGALDRMRALIHEHAPAVLPDFLILESRLRENLDREKYGSTETTRAERGEIIARLNDLAERARLAVTFSDLVWG